MSIRIDDGGPVILERPGEGGVLGSGSTVPSDGEEGYSHGCLFVHADGTTALDAVYYNVGTKASANFDSLTDSLFTTALRAYPIPLNQLRIWNDFDSFLPETAAADDLGFTEGAYGTSSPSLTTIDFKASSAEAFGRIQYPVPPEYIAGQPITITMTAACLIAAGTTAAASQNADVDVVCRRVAAPGTDICATDVQSVNSTDAGLKTFTITPTNVVPGDILDIRIEADGEDADGTDAQYLIVISDLTINFTTRIPA